MTRLVYLGREHNWLSHPSGDLLGQKGSSFPEGFFLRFHSSNHLPFLFHEFLLSPPLFLSITVSLHHSLFSPLFLSIIVCSHPVLALKKSIVPVAFQLVKPQTAGTHETPSPSSDIKGKCAAWKSLLTAVPCIKREGNMPQGINQFLLVDMGGCHWVPWTCLFWKSSRLCGLQNDYIFIVCLHEKEQMLLLLWNQWGIN